MALKMPGPTRIPKTGPYHLKVRVPSDMLSQMKGQMITLPVGEERLTVKVGEAVQVSLRTHDKRVAAARFAVADGELRALWEAHRAGPRSLTMKERKALAGVFYRFTVEDNEHDPDEAQRWHHDRLRSAIIRIAGFDPCDNGLKIKVDPEATALDSLYGLALSDLLCRRALVVDEATRQALLKDIAEAFEQAAGHLERNAEGDYSPDPKANRFPVWQAPAERPRASGLTVAALADAFLADREGKRAAGTLRRYRPILRSFATFNSGRDADAVTEVDAFAWARHRQSQEKISAGSFNQVDRKAVSAMYTWAMSLEGGRRVSRNPITRDVTLDEGVVQQGREKAFRPDEVRAILRAALAVEHDPFNPKASNARRWCPWLCAYSGARISEVTGLSKSDIRLEDGVPVMDLPETKKHRTRTVPIHPHVVELGFLEFAKAEGDGPLFFEHDRQRVYTTTTPANVAADRLGQWVRKTVNLSDELQPNHGWRHTFKTKALEMGMAASISDTITGHSGRGAGQGYEHRSVKIMHKALTDFPRYDLG